MEDNFRLLKPEAVVPVATLGSKEPLLRLNPYLSVIGWSLVLLLLTFLPSRYREKTAASMSTSPLTRLVVVAVVVFLAFLVRRFCASPPVTGEKSWIALTLLLL